MTDKKLTYTIDAADIDSGLTNFPVVVQIDSSCGDGNFDATEVFDELTGGKDEYTKLLIHAGEADESTTIADSSDSGHTITANGDAKIKDFNADGNEIVNFSGFFNGTDAYLTIPDHTDFEFGTADFTIEANIFLTDYASSDGGVFQATIVSRDVSGDRAFVFHILGTSSSYTNLSFKGFDASVSSTTVNEAHSFQLFTLYHVEVVKSGSLMYLFVDGVLLNTGGTAFTRDIKDVSTTLKIGTQNYDATYLHYFPGYISGVAVHIADLHTSTFTPPLTIAEMTNDANTVLFLDFTELDQGDTPATITDSSPSAHTVTNVSTKVSGCTFWWNGALDLDGTGDYFTVPDSSDWPESDSDVWSIDMWVFPTNKTGTSSGLVYSHSTNNSTITDALIIRVIDGAHASLPGVARLEWFYSGVNEVILASGVNSIIFNAWNHIEITGSGSNLLTLWINGVSADSDTTNITSLTLASSVHLGIASWDQSTNPFQGLIAELRITNGIARHTAAFTPPTKPYRGSWERIKITDASSNNLYIEVENWDIDNEKATLHVKVPTVSSSVDTVLMLDYDETNADNSSKIGVIGSTPGQNVWDSNFTFVSHQAQDPSGSAPQIKDSTSYAKHGTSYGTMTGGDLIDGVTGKMIDYDGTDDYTNHGYDAAHNITDTLTLEASFIPNTLLDSGLTGNPGLVSRNNDPTDSEDTYGFYISNAGLLTIASDGGGLQSTKASWASGTNFIVVGTFNSTGLVGDLFIDGVKETLSYDLYDTMAGSVNNLVIGKHQDAGDFFPGAIGEVRISNIVRSDDWITVTNLSLTDQFFTVALWSDTGVLRVSLNQSYTLYNRFHRLLLEQLYTLGLPLRNALDAKYSIKLMAILTQYYDDVPRMRVALHQWYWDATQNRRSLVQMYDEYGLIRTSFESNYHIYKTLIRKLEASYSIAGAELRQILSQQFDIKNIDLLRIKMNQPYALIEGTTTLSSPQPTLILGHRNAATPDTVTWESSALQFNSFNISASMGQYVISCTVGLSTLLDYNKCKFMDDVKLTYGGTDYIFFIKSRSKTTAYGSGIYSIALESYTGKLDTPYIRPLTDSDNIEIDTYASTIVSDMAAKANVTVDYQIIDWLVKSSAISIVGKTPLEVIRNIVNSVGSIVQSKPNSDMLIISKYPISPTEWSTSTPDRVLLLEDDVDGIQEDFEEREGYNAFIIGEQSSVSGNISLEVVDVDTTTKIVKGYRVPFTDGEFTLETSGGGSVSIDKYPYAVEEQVPDVNGDEEWEVIEFIDWQGSTSKPIYSIIDIDWIQDELTDDIGVPPLSVLDIDESGTLTVLDTDSVPSESLLRIKYMTKYWKWTIKGPVNIPIQFYVPEIEE